MVIELGSPGILPLAAGSLNGRQGILALTIQHPPIQIFAGAHSRLMVSGARAHIAHEQVVRFCRSAGLAEQAEVEIEQAIPAYMGLGSETLLGLAAAQAIHLIQREESLASAALAAGLSLRPADFPAAAGFSAGGLVFVGLAPDDQGGPQILNRVEIEHEEAEAWAVVLYFPRVEDELPESFESERWEALAAAARQVPGDESERLMAQLFSAASADSYPDFAAALQVLHDLTAAHLTPALPFAGQGEQVLAGMGAAGATAAGQSLAGLSIWGLVQGGSPSREIRKELVKQVGYYGGRVMATITDNRGAVHADKDMQLGSLNPIRPRSDLGRDR